MTARMAPLLPDFDGTVAAYEAAERMLADGRARAIGVSNFGQRHLESLIGRTEVVPAVNQVELPPFFTQRALREFHAANGIVTQAWSPLGGVKRYRPADADAVENPLEHPAVVELAAKYGRTPAQIVLRWHLEHGVSAIPKSVKAHRIERTSTSSTSRSRRTRSRRSTPSTPVRAAVPTPSSSTP